MTVSADGRRLEYLVSRQPPLRFGLDAAEVLAPSRLPFQPFRASLAVSRGQTLNLVQPRLACWVTDHGTASSSGPLASYVPLIKERRGRASRLARGAICRRPSWHRGLPRAVSRRRTPRASRAGPLAPDQGAAPPRARFARAHPLPPGRTQPPSARAPVVAFAPRLRRFRCARRPGFALRRFAPRLRRFRCARRPGFALRRFAPRLRCFRCARRPGFALRRFAPRSRLAWHRPWRHGQATSHPGASVGLRRPGGTPDPGQGPEASRCDGTDRTEARRGTSAPAAIHEGRKGFVRSRREHGRSPSSRARARGPRLPCGSSLRSRDTASQPRPRRARSRGLNATERWWPILWARTLDPGATNTTAAARAPHGDAHTGHGDAGDRAVSRKDFPHLRGKPVNDLARVQVEVDWDQPISGLVARRGPHRNEPRASVDVAGVAPRG